jgi:hypothetical protein
MAYFNHAFQKSFLATGINLNEDVPLLNGGTVSATTAGGFLTTSGVPTYGLNTLSTIAEDSNGTYQSGYIGIFDPKTNLSLNLGCDGPLLLAAGPTCCPFYIAGSAIYNNDKIGPFHGGYTETNKSKVINPKYVSRFYSVEACQPQNEIVHVGSTYATAGGGILSSSTSGGPIDGQTPNLNVFTPVALVGGTGTGATILIRTDGSGVVIAISTPDNAVLGKGYSIGDTLTVDGDSSGFQLTVNDVTSAIVDPITGSGGAACCKEFLCGETYNLRLDIKGSPALRYLNHNAYYIAEAYTGCCPEGSIAPVAVNSTYVMIKWADAILRYPVVNPFVRIVIQDEAGVLWYAPGTSAQDLSTLGGDTWDNYPEGIAHTEGACAGLVFEGAYVDTKFGDCTFQLTDFYEKEPVKLYLSELDLNGDPCTFDGICVVHECLATQANGLGETLLRDLVLSESYRQNFLHSDFRIREITQGNQLITAINRSALYNTVYLQHNVPRYNNPTGVFDNDQYLLQIIFPAFGDGFTGFETFTSCVGDYLANCGVCELEAFLCESNCDVPIAIPPLTNKRKD